MPQARRKYGTWVVGGVAAVMSACAQPRQAARVCGATERLREEIGAPLSPTERAEHDVQVSAARAAMPDHAAFELAWQEGRAMTLEDVIKFALGNTPEWLTSARET